MRQEPADAHDEAWPVVVDGIVSPAGTAVLAAEDRGFQLGLAVFETLRVERGVPLFLAAHTIRLQSGAASIGLRAPDAREIDATVNAMLAAVESKTCALRLTWTAGAREPRLVATARSVGREVPGGVTARVSEFRLPLDDLAGIKSVSRLRHTLALEGAKSHGAHEALLFNTDGDLAEGAVSNVFVVLPGGLFTPGLDRGCLGGLTRQRLLDDLAGTPLTDSEGGPLPMLERRVSLDELLGAREILLTGSTSRVRGVARLERADAPALELPGASGAVRCALWARLLALEELERGAYAAARPGPP